MNLHQVTFNTPSGSVRRQFAGSADAASKLATELKKSGRATDKPERESVEIATDKVGLIKWLNENASVVE